MGKLNILAGAACALALGFAGAASAVTVESTNFIAEPAFFNGFEYIAANPNFIPQFYFPSNTAYSEGGITIEYVGRATDQMWLQYLFEDSFGWNANNGGIGYTKVTLTNGADFAALQFLSGTGYRSVGSTTYYQALNNGNVVSTGTLGRVSGDGLRYQGLSGGGFDEVRLQSTVARGFDPAVFDAGAYDSFAANSAAPEPAAWALMIGGFGLAGGMIRRRKAAIA